MFNAGILTIREKRRATVKYGAILPDHLGPKSWSSGKAQGSNSSSFSASLSSSGIPASKYASSCFYVRKTKITFYKALTRGKSNFKSKTSTVTRENYRNFETHLRVHARSVCHFGLHQMRRTLRTVGHLSTDSVVNGERVLCAFYRKLTSDQSSCRTIHDLTYDWFIMWYEPITCDRCDRTLNFDPNHER